ncbi:hypothetical protein M5K25_024316 [Dendrobium thyrsiflorum]|uniref:Uncharacterized protein n=1 Tax=Dendrobium thyrsiflorum TaxID=117978 RepID=A0ABD0U1K8_DENTH
MRNDHGGSAKVLGARGIPLASLRLLNCFISSHTYYHFSISDMAITKDEGRIGGKFFKRPLWRLPPTPYDRPPSAVREMSRPQPANEAGRSGWFSKLVDSAAQIIVKGVPPLFSSVFGKGVASTPGENINTIEEVAEMKSPPEVSEKCGNHIDITISIDYDGSDESKEELISNIDAFFQLKQVNKKKRSRAEVGQLGELIYSKSIEIPGHQKKKVEINNNSNINPNSSHQIREEDFGNFFTFGCKSQINHKDCQNSGIKKVTRKSEMYKMARSPYFGSSLMTNTKVLERGCSDRDEQFFNDARRVRQKSCLKDLNLTTHDDTSSTLFLDQEQKRRRIDSKGLKNSDCKISLACENINTIEEVAEMKSPPEVSEKCGNHIDITLSIDYDGSAESKEELISNIDAFFQLKQLNKKKRSRAEISQLGELIYSKSIEIPGHQKKKVEINNNSNINPSSSHQIREEDFGNFFTFGCKSQINHKDCQNNGITQKVTRKSEMYKMARSPYFGSSLMTNTRVLKRGSSDRDEQFFNDARRVRQKSCLKDSNLTTHADTSSTLIILDEEEKHGSSDRDEQCFEDARRARQKYCLKDLNLTTHADTSSTLFLDQEQKRRRIDSKGLNNSDCKIPLACDLFAPPPQSMELAKKILYEINKI